MITGALFATSDKLNQDKDLDMDNITYAIHDY